MLAGNNSILQKATDAKERTERAEIIENAQMDILGKQAENNGSLSEDELEEILTSTNYNTQGRLSNESSILDRTLTSKDGKYSIPVKEIFNGTLSKSLKSITSLQEGDYVFYSYTALNGEESKIECIVLYNTSEYGIQIIPQNTIGTFELGNGTGSGTRNEELEQFNIAMNSYNYVIENLNREAENYWNKNIVSSVRAVGSNPTDTSKSSNTSLIMYTTENGYSYASEYDGLFRTKDEPYNTDYSKMKDLGIHKASDNKAYWLASRYIKNGSSTCSFSVPIVIPNGSVNKNFTLCAVGKTKIDASWSTEYGTRPVFRLSPELKILSGSGTSIEPYNIGFN